MAVRVYKIHRKFRKKGFEVSFTAIVDAFKDSSFGIGELFAAFKDFIYHLYNSDHIIEMREIVWSFFGQFDRLLPLALFAVFAVITFFGKRIYPVLRFILFFIMGFGLGIYLLATPIVGMLPNMPVWLIGLAAGIVISVLSKFLYYPTLALFIAAPVYTLFHSGMGVAALSSIFEGNMIAAAVAAIAAVVLAFLVLKFAEMLLTAMLGGYGIAVVIKALFDYTAFGIFAGREWLGVLLVTLLFAIPGFIVQVRTRKRY